MSEFADVVVVGAGIHGCGVAQAAAAAGHSVLVLEREAIAHGTSSRSSKLIHGGLRYLERLELGLVRECLRERRLLLRLAPDLVRLRHFHLPIYAATSRRPWQVRIGLSAYALLGGLRAENRFTSLRAAAWDGLDGLTTRGLQAVFRYSDAQTDDAALTRAVMASAAALGARLECPASFLGARVHRDAVDVYYRRDGKQRQVRARALVNAAGPWVNEVLSAVDPAMAPRAIERVQGSHLLLDHSLRQGIYYLEAPRDRRPVFVMPNASGTLVGTTEVAFRGDPGRARTSDAEADYLMEAVRHYFPALATARELNRFAGVRVLPAGLGPAGRRSRETVLHPGGRRQERVISVYGGKLTSYRATADRVLRRLRRALPRRPRVARTDELPLRNNS